MVIMARNVFSSGLWPVELFIFLNYRFLLLVLVLVNIFFCLWHRHLMCVCEVVFQIS